MKLVIVESPTKAKTISQFLGESYRVVSSYGHVRDLPKSKLGVDIDHNFEPQYVIPTKVRKRVNELKKDAQKATELILATDEDREGEAIAWHLIQALGLGSTKSKAQNPKQIERIVFHEITKQAIEEALKNPRSIDEKLVDAQQARRVLDRLVGYNLSPFLWKKVARGLSAGRVQSVALRLIVERERERRAFQAQEYWNVVASLQVPNPKSPPADGRAGKIQNALEAELIEWNKQKLGKFDIQNEKQTKEIIKALQGIEWEIANVEVKERKLNPPLPFRTSTMQQEASRRFGFSAKQTMMIAQQLYEGIEVNGRSTGLITYMRTDSANLSNQFLTAAQRVLSQHFGNEYAQGSRRYTSQAKGAQEAHEAIRPSDPALIPQELQKELLPRQWRLYDLIWRRAMASQMPQARLRAKTIDVVAKDRALFRANGSTTDFDGFMRLWPSSRKESELPDVSQGQKITCKKITPNQHFTEPAPRYSEATLVKTLEENGIGRPSTYAPTLSTIQDRGYVMRDENRRLFPTELGELVNGLLVEHFPELVDVTFTATMEKELDEVAEGLQQYVTVVRDFWKPFSSHVEEKLETVKEIKVKEPTDETCPRCGKPLVIKLGRFGRFLACTGFPDCKTTKSIKENRTNVICPRCKKGELVCKRSRRGKVFYGCSDYPDCDFALWDKPNGKACPNCNSLLVMKRGEERCSDKTCKWLPPTAIQ
ncbi:MAG: DNA topoisomerase I [Candidatus Terrybacteria bacterium RIFCSPHIGHO2_01_FULL_48_17]|uniref:DNA topoisomerase 1 n=1 Tax=Candidatus Terrybacteria bacterium RIFCSPHIGHO2_01_FULL_48_17 TaxID=1802362 RepID=A0A1G2PJF4_9BACT|nr:MAG: DNA topoisomerase I [Candidatus Terrybacteria bacterium RIFCSPHIGHO2_01_FULL_48_17]OHA52284.1 MAG: DNA topoisomerase I [Candidatus Terrybacteria bacterium RIFCSPLOWO2_01_FULL_48_14]